MCIHSQAELDEYNRFASQKVSPLAAVIMRDPVTSAFNEAYFTNALDRQQIANTIRNLHAWHPGAKIVDLTEVNKRREVFGMTSIRESSLPSPTGEAPPSEPMDVSVDDYFEALSKTELYAVGA